MGFTLAAFGPVGMLAGKAVGEVLADDAPLPILLCDRIDGGIALGDESRDASRVA